MARYNIAKLHILNYTFIMPKVKMYSEGELAALAMRYRKQAGKTRAQTARDMEVSQTTIFNAEESLIKVRMRMIEAYSSFKVVGPVFKLEKKQ